MGTTTVNGPPALEKYPIESTYHIPTATVRADVAASVLAAGYTGDPSQVHLTANAQTEQTKGKVWTLTHTAADGTQDVILDPKNRPLQYAIPQNSGDFARSRQAIIDQKLNEARKERDF